MTKNKGFTYYELLIVITIMSLLAGFSTISIGAVYRNNVNRGTDAVMSACKAARNNAISKGTEYGWVNFYYNNGALYSYVGEEITATNPVDFDTQNWNKVTSAFDEVEFDGVTLHDGNVCSLGFKQATGEYRGHDFPLGGSPGIHTVYPMKIELHKHDSTSEIDIKKVGNIEKVK